MSGWCVMFDFLWQSEERGKGLERAEMAATDNWLHAKCIKLSDKICKHQVLICFSPHLYKNSQHLHDFRKKKRYASVQQNLHLCPGYGWYLPLQFYSVLVGGEQKEDDNWINKIKQIMWGFKNTNHLIYTSAAHDSPALFHISGVTFVLTCTC